MTEPYSRKWDIIVFGNRKFFEGSRDFYLTTQGPVQPKLRADGSVALEHYDETIALFLPGTVVGFIQEPHPEVDEEPEDEVESEEQDEDEDEFTEPGSF